MPIYAYKCEACGFSKDVLQKLSDDALSECPGCGEQSFQKQLTAAGFQLKGSGWYVTDFKGAKAPAPAAGDGKTDAAASPSAEPSADTKAPAKADQPNGGKADTAATSSADVGAAKSGAVASAPAAASSSTSPAPASTRPSQSS